MVYQAKGEYDKALEFFQKSLTIREEVLGKKHPDPATSYNNIGMVYNSKGEYDKALEFFQKSLTIREEVLGKKHPNTATSYNNIAGVYHRSKGEYDKALEFYQKSLAIHEEVLGTKHPNTATSYNNIGEVYRRAKGEYDKALEFYQKSLTIKEEVLGKKHPNTATSYNNIGEVYRAKGEYDKALEFYQKALKININIYGTAHKNSEIVYNNIIAFKNNFFINSSHLDKALYLDRVHIENFKLLKNFEMSFTQGVNIIIGENSSGKTSLLQAITLGLMKQGSFDDFNDFEKYISKTKFESKINLYFDGYEKHTTLKSNAREVDNNVLSPFVVAYGSNIFTKYKLEADNIVNDMLSGNIRRDFTTSIFQDYTDKIHNPKSILNKLSELARNRNKKAKEYEVIFREKINDFIEGFDLIKDEQSKQYIFKCTEGNHFRLENLSEGYRNSVLLIGDILVKVLGVGEKPDTIEGVILIDEFDRHLHPKWQSNLVTKLTTIFPKIQFILTTHNPMSVMDREGNEITVLREIDGKLIAIKESGTKNIDVCTVLLKYFSVESTISQSMKKKVDDFNRLKLKKILSNEEEQTLGELEEFLGQTVASNFIYDSKYLQFLEFIKEHTEIDFEKYNQISEEEAQELLEKFKGFFDD
jgi:predicted ATP-binding protein involved in virulence/Tfp pilus assembly protein PilF